MDAVWVGVVGTIAGGVVGSTTSLLSPLILWNTKEKELKLAHQHKAMESAREYKRELVTSWRAGLAELRMSNRAWSYDQTDEVPYPEPDEMVWYASLRPHLDEALAKRMDMGVDDPTWREVSRRIAELEREWELV